MQMKNKAINLIQKNRFGFFELKEKPTAQELAKYYTDAYYQQSLSSTYQRSYSEVEITYIKNKLEEKYLVLKEILSGEEDINRDFLDIGAGEGWALDFFKNKDWNCVGLDYSNFGCSLHNPHCLKNLIVGDICENIPSLIKWKKRFYVIWMSALLEHVLDPLSLLNSARQLAHDKGILVISVPNDFSFIQQYLLDKKYISEPFWISYPAHINYFNRDGLISICNEAGWQVIDIIGSYPIDFNLFNENTNYVDNKPVGKSCHQARIDIENLLFSAAPEKTIEMYRIFAQIGIGRGIVGFFQKKQNTAELRAAL